MAIELVSQVQPLQDVARQVSLVWPDPAMGSHIQPIQAMTNFGQAAMAILVTSIYNVQTGNQSVQYPVRGSQGCRLAI